MRILAIFILACAWFSMAAQEQSFTVVVVPNKLSYAGTGQTDANGNPMRGANFVMSGYIYPGDYFDLNCPAGMNCGINSDGTAEHPAEVVGTWSFRGFTTIDLAQALGAGGTPTHSNQLFAFDAGFTDCPSCVISIDGPDHYGKDENVVFKKVIVGSTTDTYRLMRGEVEQIIFKQPENKNATGSYNLKATFYFAKN